jgi:hypothetical protein
VGKALYIAGAALVVAMLALAQRLTNYTSGDWGFRLFVLACVLTVGLVANGIRDFIRRSRIDGEAYNFEMDDKVIETPVAYSVDIKFKITARSGRPDRTNITEIRIDGSKNVPPIEFSRLEGLPANLILELGISSTFDLYARATFRSVRMGELTRVDTTKVKIWLVDGSGTAHRIPVRTAQTLSLS